MRPVLPPVVLLCCLSLFALPARALPGEADAIIRHCGAPRAEHMGKSEVTYKPQRDLIYDDLILHFEPLEGGWSFTTAWRGHFPATRNELERSLPCFRAAMDEVAAAAPPTLDPTIAQQTTLAQPETASNWGIDHFWLIVALAISMLLVLMLPRRRPPAPTRTPADRQYRQPSLRSRILNRQPPDE